MARPNRRQSQKRKSVVPGRVQRRLSSLSSKAKRNFREAATSGLTGIETMLSSFRSKAFNSDLFDRLQRLAQALPPARGLGGAQRPRATVRLERERRLGRIAAGAYKKEFHDSSPEVRKEQYACKQRPEPHKARKRGGGASKTWVPWCTH